MSEYQYYEFQAIGRPLDERAMAALRSITSRARITPTSLVNVYHFGAFKGDPVRLMDQYFDVHLYVANWGTRRLMLRFPACSFPPASAAPYAVPHVLEARATNDHTILDFHSDSEDGSDDFGEGEGWLAALLPLRSDLLAGDLRCLYLAWLGGVQTGEVDDSGVEPPVPPGLRHLSAPLRRFLDFIRLDPDLVEVAAAVSAEGLPDTPPADQLAAWVAGLPRAETDRALVRLMQGGGTPLAGELLRRFRQDQARRQVRAGGNEGAGKVRRSAGELLRAWARVTEENKRKAAERAAQEEARRARELAAARTRHLDALAGREEELWRQAEAAILSRQAKGYGQAVELLRDLLDLGARTGTGAELAARIRELRERHRGKSTLLRRLDQAGLPK